MSRVYWAKGNRLWFDILRVRIIRGWYYWTSTAIIFQVRKFTPLLWIGLQIYQMAIYLSACVLYCEHDNCHDPIISKIVWIVYLGLDGFFHEVHSSHDNDTFCKEHNRLIGYFDSAEFCAIHCIGKAPMFAFEGRGLENQTCGRDKDCRCYCLEKCKKHLGIQKFTLYEFTPLPDRLNQMFEGKIVSKVCEIVYIF